MNTRRVRFKLKTMIAAIFCVGLAIHLALSAWRVYSLKLHMHTAIIVNSGVPEPFTGFTWAPFWPTYWRTILGIPLNCKRLCEYEPRFLVERCELETPETRPYRITSGFTTDHGYFYRITPDVTADEIEPYMKLVHELGHDARYENSRITVYYRPAVSVRSSKP